MPVEPKKSCEERTESRGFYGSFVNRMKNRKFVPAVELSSQGKNGGEAAGKKAASRPPFTVGLRSRKSKWPKLQNEIGGAEISGKKVETEDPDDALLDWCMPQKPSSSRGNKRSSSASLEVEIVTVDESQDDDEVKVMPQVSEPVEKLVLFTFLNGKTVSIHMSPKDKLEGAFVEVARSVGCQVTDLSMTATGDARSILPHMHLSDVVHASDPVPMIDCSVNKSGDVAEWKMSTTDSVEIKFQTKDARRVMELRVGKDESFGFVKKRLAAKLGVAPDARLFFDSAFLSDSTTPNQQDMEDGDVVDVMESSCSV